MEAIVLALAATAQAIHQVNKIAWTGQSDEAEYLPLLESVLVIDSDNVNTIYKGPANLTTGLNLLAAQLGNPGNNQQLELGRYLASLVSIEKAFSRNREVQEILGTRITQVKRLAEFESIGSPAVLASMADAYSQSISTLPLRIQVKGEPSILQAQSHQNKIRAILLAAVRGIVLWRQVGGRKRHFIFKRKQLLEETTSLLNAPM
ncbi:high frequency lysogenization protein HflD [Pleionea sp. CnH1-48]|uniref:high frequency lysogenization protein HflD n=1 Tax=Pleionea sp. CnH1-48 TaxID=2954494 RepID=UPI0020973DCB|nr:high frequency lysogenization protein HflD [Pleionea sp. CnH1-48]MCO7222772.1 high frequency lysogenization protein HflD [Pleionea sp. CnH1-48]